MSKSFYLVTYNTATPAKCDTKFDGYNTFLCYCETQENALDLATQYDDGDILMGNVWYNGQSYTALS